MFRMIQFWIKYLDTWRNPMYIYIEDDTKRSVAVSLLTCGVNHVSAMLHVYLGWLWYWKCWWYCVRNDPIFYQIPRHMEKSYVQLHRSPNIIKYFCFATHMCVFLFFRYVKFRLTSILLPLITLCSEWSRFGSYTLTHGEIVCTSR